MANNNKRGFAQDPQKASEAGKKAHEEGTAHEFDSEEARKAASLRGSYEQTNMDLRNLGEEDGEESSARGFKKMQEEGREDEVSEIASMGGSASHGGDRLSQDDEE